MPPFIRMLVIALVLGMVTWAIVWGLLKIREMRHEKEMAEMEHEHELEDELFGDGRDDIDRELAAGRERR